MFGNGWCVVYNNAETINVVFWIIIVCEWDVCYEKVDGFVFKGEVAEIKGLFSS